MATTIDGDRALAQPEPDTMPDGRRELLHLDAEGQL